MTKLKPCPFCGGTNLDIDGGYVACMNKKCGAYDCGVIDTAWNTRPAEERMERALEVALNYMQPFGGKGTTPYAEYKKIESILGKETIATILESSDK